jgi:hypothetical protein
MKNFILGLIVMLTTFSVASAGECASGYCVHPRKVVTVTKNVVRETVRLPRRVVSGCVNGTCRSRTVTVVR